MTEKNQKSLMTFEDVLSDYLFFQQHITEISEMKRHFGIHLSKMAFKNTPIRYLDFGCGDGSIGESLAQNVANLTGKTQFAIVEPTEAQRTSAITRLKKASSWPVIAYEYLPDTAPQAPSEKYDFILASHSLYYVPDVKKTVKDLHEWMGPSSLFIIAMECSKSPTKKIWDTFFTSINRPIPYHLSEEVKEALESLGIEYEIDPLVASMEFPDTTDNRRHIARFLLEPYFKLQDEEKTLSFFDQFSRNGVVSAEMSNDLYIIKRP